VQLKEKKGYVPTRRDVDLNEWDHEHFIRFKMVYLLPVRGATQYTLKINTM
jgi:hypothetical protein